MGGFTPQAIMTVLGTGLGVAQGQRQARAQRNAATAAANAQAAEIEAQRQTAERDREARLARTLAGARARFAARGLAPDQGSAAALLDGLTRDSEQESEDMRLRVEARLDALNTRAERDGPGFLETAFPRLMFDVVRRRLPRRSLLDF